MKPLHPQVMVVRLPDSIRSSQTNLFIIVLHDGKEWKVMHSLPLPREKAEERARWLSDVLEHARDAALEEAAKVVDASRAILAFCECDPDIGHTGACKRLTDALQEYDAMKGVRDA